MLIEIYLGQKKHFLKKSDGLSESLYWSGVLIL
jgi:hypothetical protein